MKEVYILESLKLRGRRYRGLADNTQERLLRHNEGSVPSTAPYRPWKLVLSIRSEDDTRAAAFEQYLKSGSGHSFARRHFW